MVEEREEVNKVRYSTAPGDKEYKDISGYQLATEYDC